MVTCVIFKFNGCETNRRYYLLSKRYRLISVVNGIISVYEEKN